MNRGTKRRQKPRASFIVFALAFVVGFIIFSTALAANTQAAKKHDVLRAEAHSVVLRSSPEQQAGELAKPQVVDAPKGNKSSMDFPTLEAAAPNIRAWLFSEGTIIDYPVMQTDDNSYYLDHLYSGEKSRVGSLFIDYRNTGYFTDKNTVIYGHNMRNGAMFYSLCEYKRQEYYDEFPVMQLFTPSGDYIIELFSGTIENGSFDTFQFTFQNDKAFLQYVNGFRARSVFNSQVEVTGEDTIVTLCTCSYEFDNSRFVVMGKLVPIKG